MAGYSIPYGRTQLEFQLPDTFKVASLIPSPIPPTPSPIQATDDALDHLITAPGHQLRLADFASARSVAIAINDKTRPVPLSILLPPLLARLRRLGIPDHAVTLVIAAGTHLPMSPIEFERVLPPEIIAQYRVLCHDADDRARLVDRGATTRGTPVWIERTFAEADLKIVVGNLEPHQFVGFSGGVKTAAIGLAGRDTITHNHAMMTDPRANIARYDDNPARQDIEEIGRRIGIPLAVNAIVNQAKQIVHVLAGEPVAVMQRGIPLVRALYEVRASAPFDLTITAPGGHPKDINLYQAQKALAHATFVTKRGGTIILAAACPEGTGSPIYEDWVAGMPSHASVIERFRAEGYRLGPHKAFQIARDATYARVLMVSEMAPELVRRLLLTPYDNLDAALGVALAELAPGAAIGIIPWANATIPVL